MNNLHMRQQAGAEMTLTEPGSTRGHTAHSRLLAFGRVVWWLTTALSIIVFVPSAFQLYVDLQTVCTGKMSCTPIELNSEALRSLHSFGWSPTTYAAFTVGLATFSMAAWMGIGIFIAWRKWNDLMALLVSAQAVTQGVSQVVAVEAFHSSIWFVPAIVISFLSGWFLFLLFALFPTGRFAPRWLRWAAVAYFVFNVANSLPYTMYPAAAAETVSSASNVIWFGFMALLIVCQIYRYRRVSNVIERQQTKWIVFAFSAIIISEFALALPQAFVPTLAQVGSQYSLALNAIDMVILLIGPVCIAIAIMRYRLYDIDILIKRTLVYGSLTAILAALYFALVIGAQTLTHRLTGLAVAEQPVVIVLSTLLIAALAQPLRRRLQRTIDRRFDRSHYDAAKTVAAFSAALRSEVNLQQLNEQLLGVVEETMRPAHASLWLRAPAQAQGDSHSERA
jgi:hypothetical protein